MASRHGGNRKAGGPGEPVIFDVFYKEHYPKAVKFAIAAYFANDKGSAEDVVQEVMVNMCEKWENLPVKPGKRGAYLFAAVRNRAISQLARRTREVPLETWAEPASRPDGERLADLDVRAAIMRLPVKEREVAALVILADLPHAQVAEVTGIRPRTVRLRLSEARRKLQGWLRPMSSAGKAPAMP